MNADVGDGRTGRRHLVVAPDVRSGVRGAASKTVSCNDCVVTFELTDAAAPKPGGIVQLESACFGSVVGTF